MNALSFDLKLHLERSKCINAFVELEQVLGQIAEVLAKGYENELISQRINRLRDVPASSIFSKEQRKLLHLALAEAERLILIRNDIVHGALTVLIDGKKPIAAFINVRQSDRLAPVARLMTCEQLGEVAEKSRHLCQSLKKAMLKPAKQTVAS